MIEKKNVKIFHDGNYCCAVPVLCINTHIYAFYDFLMISRARIVLKKLSPHIVVVI